MASRPPDDAARNRWAIIQFNRLLGVALVIVGLVAVEGLIELPDLAAYALIVLGLADVFIAPLVLARLWRTPRE